jgi:hypothetical protein
MIFFLTFDVDASQYFKNIENQISSPVTKPAHLPKGTEVLKLEEAERPRLQRVDTFRINTIDERRQMEEEGTKSERTPEWGERAEGGRGNKKVAFD